VGVPIDATSQLLQELLLYALLPLWLLAGFGDWLLHRWQRIEDKVGWREPALHVLMVAELGVAVAAALLLQINAAVLVILLLAAIAHELTVWTDLSYAAARRRIPVPEQWVHGLQNVLPWAALAALAVIHRDQAMALIGQGAVAADWSLRFKQPPLRDVELLAVFSAGLLLAALPFLAELVRGVRASRRVTASSQQERLPTSQTRRKPLSNPIVG
jgi:hypothetical protein